jgi:hypothetical protein
MICLDLSVQAESSGVFFSRVKESSSSGADSTLTTWSLKEIAPLGLERCGIRKNGDRKGEGREVSETFECVFERSAGLPIPNILVEIQVRQSCNDEHVGRKFLQSLGHTSDKFGELKTRKGARDTNEAIHARWVNAAFSCETCYQEWTDLVCAVQIKNLFLSEE